MTRRLRVTGPALAAACASRTGAGTSTPAPVTSPPSAPAAAPVQPIAQPAPRRSDLIHYGPSALRYVVHRQLHIQQGQAERPQAQDLGARIYVAATIAGPADSVGYPATFTVDSIVPDSGTPPPVAENVSKARKLVFSGRLLPRGEFVNAVPSDSVLAQSLVQLLAGFRDFLPRIPRDGLKPGAAWTDTVEATRKGPAPRSRGGPSSAPPPRRGKTTLSRTASASRRARPTKSRVPGKTAASRSSWRGPAARRPSPSLPPADVTSAGHALTPRRLRCACPCSGSPSPGSRSPTHPCRGHPLRR